MHQIIDDSYGVRPVGLPGNDDLGTMSAWYVFAAIGLFPQVPGRAEMLVGSPVFTRVVIDRGNGVRMTVNATSTDTYVQAATFRGREHDRSWLPEAFVRHGGTVGLALGPDPNTTWATRPGDLPRDH